MAAVEHDENSERGFSGANAKRDSRCSFVEVPPKSANTLHRHPKAEEFYFVVEGTGRMRVSEETRTVPKHGRLLVGPKLLRQVFNDTDEEVLWLIVGAPEKEFEEGEAQDMKVYYPVDPTQLPKELAGKVWPPK